MKQTTETTETSIIDTPVVFRERTQTKNERATNRHRHRRLQKQQAHETRENVPLPPSPPSFLFFSLTGVEVRVEAVSALPRGHELHLGRRLRVVVREEYVEGEQAAGVRGVVWAGDHHL